MVGLVGPPPRREEKLVPVGVAPDDAAVVEDGHARGLGDLFGFGYGCCANLKWGLVSLSWENKKGEGIDHCDKFI